MNLSIIIPLYNEENSICQLLEKLVCLEFPAFVENAEIVIVDDFSADNSAEAVKCYCQSHPEIRLIRHKTNGGKGEAVATGIKNATGDVFLIQDSDLELCPDDIAVLLAAMENLGVEFVNGSRYLAGALRPLSSYKRYLGNKLFSILASIIINVKITDIACGYKLFSRNLYNKLKLKEKRFGFEAELIIKALRVRKNNMTEVPVRYFPRNEGEGKKFRNTDAIRILWTIFKYGLFRMN